MANSPASRQIKSSVTHSPRFPEREPDLRKSLQPTTNTHHKLANQPAHTQNPNSLPQKNHHPPAKTSKSPISNLATNTGTSDSQKAQSTQPMPLTIKPPRPPSDEPPSTAAASQPTSSSNDGSSSPVAPAYSPITPKVQPVLPVAGHSNDGFEVPPVPPANPLPDVNMRDESPPDHSYEHLPHPATAGKAPIPPPPPPSAIPETQYIPEPPPQPFSSEDSADAIALRAAISALQFQKQKAQEDLQTLETLKKRAGQEPERFRRELIAGKLKEERPSFGGIRDVLEAPAGEDDDDDEVVLGAQEEHELPASRTGIDPNSLQSPSSKQQSSDTQAPFPKIPGPQDIVRMPPVNWDKYHIVGESLDALHEQQRRWPGSIPGQDNRGREHSVAAPYSPFHDTLDPQAQAQGQRNGSTGSALGTPAVEHPMETRRTSRN